MKKNQTSSNTSFSHKFYRDNQEGFSFTLQSAMYMHIPYASSLKNWVPLLCKKLKPLWNFNNSELLAKKKTTQKTKGLVLHLWHFMVCWGHSQDQPQVLDGSGWGLTGQRTRHPHGHGLLQWKGTKQDQQRLKLDEVKTGKNQPWASKRPISAESYTQVVTTCVKC